MLKDGRIFENIREEDLVVVEGGKDSLRDLLSLVVSGDKSA